MRETAAASDLDQVITAHNEFLTVVTTHCLLDSKSRVSLSHLITGSSVIIIIMQLSNLSSLDSYCAGTVFYELFRQWTVDYTVAMQTPTCIIEVC